MKIRILLVDDHKILREGICSLVKGYADMEVVGEAADGRTALSLVQELAPDVVIMEFLEREHPATLLKIVPLTNLSMQ